jgi:hypothetical protein
MSHNSHMSPKSGVPKPLPPAAPRNLSSKQFVTVYRGLRNVDPKSVDTEKLGSHWSTSPNVAHGFALYHPNATFIDPKYGQHATVLKGRVHPSQVVKPHTEEWYDMGGIRPGSEEEQRYEAGFDMNNHVILPPDSTEEEHTVRPESKVKIAGMTHMTDLHMEASRSQKNFRTNKKGKA